MAVPVLDDPPIWYFYDSGTIKGDLQPDVNFIFVEEASVPHMDAESFSAIRRIRRELTWLHADLQFIIEVGRAVERMDTRVNQKLVEATRNIANGLSQLDRDEERGFSPLLFAAWSEARSEMLDLLRQQSWVSFQSPLPEWLKDRVRHRSDERRRVYHYTLLNALEQVRNDYPDGIQLGEVNLVDSRLIDGDATHEYVKERYSVLATYSNLPPHERMRISIVIPFRGGVFPLIACLESIARQTLLRACPEDIEILLIEDGLVDPANPVVQSQEIHDLLFDLLINKVKVRRFKLDKNMGRATARNVGIFNATGEIVAFVDASMVLDQGHLAEHVIRHHRISNIALLGFKENLRLPSYTIESCRAMLTELARDAEARQDWKWHHVIIDDDLDEDGAFRFKSGRFLKGQAINYMRLTEWLRGFSATELIGPRSLATFFQTNIVSTPIWPVRLAGGFHSPFKDKLWGLEDSHLGALLLANGVRFVPCPSATAFKIEHDEGPEQRHFDLIRHRQLYKELVGERVRHRAHEAHEEIINLKSKGGLSELDWELESNKPGAT